MNIEERVRHIIAEQLDMPMERVVAEAKIEDDLEADELQLEIIMEMEDEFGFKIPDCESESLQTVGDFVERVKRMSPEG